MFKKITSPLQIDKLRPGVIVIRHPLNLKPVPEIDLSSEQNFELFEVERISVFSSTITLRTPVEKISSYGVMDPENPAMSKISFSKSAKDVIAESVWWFREEDIEPETLSIHNN